MTEEHDTTNNGLVGLQGDMIVFLKPVGKLTKAEALNLAAWMVVLADDEDNFPALLDAVKNL